MADDFSQIAKDFIDRANGGTGPTGTWRLEVLQKRFSPKAGREIPIRIRRFLKGIPWAHVHDAIRYLISQSPYEGIIYNGVELKGQYRPTLTQWRRDDQEQVGGNAQGSYTLIQDLIEVTDGDKLDTVSADSCAETEKTTWVWDAPEIEELPYDGSQGVTYAIRQVRRNEDGTFDYAIVEQVAKTKISDWKVTECDEYSTVRVRIFDNVYGGLYEGDPFTDGTTVLPIPAPCKTDNGTLVQVSVAQNPDCTFRVTVQEIVAKQNVGKTSETRKGLRGVVTSESTVATNPLPEIGLELGEQVRNERRPDGLYDVTHVKVLRESVGDIGSSCERTVFEHQHAEIRNEAVRPEDEASSAGGGKTYQVQARATEEGTWDVTRTETTEIARTGAQKTKQKTLRGITETTVDRNVDNNDVTVTNIGDRVSVEMTPGGKYNRTVTKVSKESVGDIGSSCETTVFEHRHVESENVASRPEKEASSAGGGKTYQVQARATEEGTWDVTRTETTEIERKGAQKTKQKTLRGVTETTVDRNVSNSSVEVTNVGDRVSVEMTPGGRYNRTVTRVDRTAGAIDLGNQCQKTVFEHQQRKDTVVSSKPADIHVGDAGGGKTRQRTLRQTEEGAWEVSDVETVELVKTGAQHSKQKTLRGVTETTVDRNVSNSSVEVTNVGDRVSVEMTPGGRYNRTVTRVVRTAKAIDLGDQCQKTVFEHQQRKDTVVSSKPSGIHVDDAGDGKTRQRTLRQTEEGAWEVSDVETAELEKTGAQHSKQKTLRGVIETTVDRNVSNADVEVTNVGDRVSVEMTPGGRYNRTVTRVDRTAGATDLGDQCQKTVFEHQQRKDTVVSSKPADIHVGDAGGGKTRQRTIRQTEEGAWEVSDVETRELPQRFARVEKRKTMRGVTETTVSRNVTDSSAAVANVGDVVIVEMTPGGRYNRTVSRVASDPVGEIRRDCQRSGDVEHTDVTVRNVASYSGGGHADTPGRNKVVRRTVKLTEEGTFDVEDETRTYSPVTAVARSEWATETVITRVVRHSLQNGEVVANNGDASAEPDETGAWTTRVTEGVPREIDTGWLTWPSVVKTPTSTLKYKCGLRVFKNKPQPPTPDTAADCNVSMSVNKYGRYDGTITYRELTDWKREGSGGGGGGVGTQTFWRRTAVSADRVFGEFQLVQVRVYQGGISASQMASEMNGKDVTVKSAGGCVIFEKILQYGNVMRL